MNRTLKTAACCLSCALAAIPDEAAASTSET